MFCDLLVAALEKACVSGHHRRIGLALNTAGFSACGLTGGAGRPQPEHRVVVSRLLLAAPEEPGRAWPGTLTFGVGERRTFVPSNYLRSGAIEYGYALTVHQAQGLTTNRTFLLGDGALYREIGYVGLSRARQHAELHLTSATDQFDADRDSCCPAREGLAGDDALAHAKRALAQSRAQRSAHDLSR
jgi:hypothetical protein